jgi:NRPS condensation-like uncharacterized protein
MPRTLPLTWGDEAILHLESASDPWNIQMEIGDSQRIDPGALRAAVHASCLAHPIMRSRLVLAAPHQTFDHWEVVDDVTPMSIPVVDCPDETTLARLRTDFYSPPFPMHEAPQFRVQVARRPHGDLVQVNAAHVAVDGIGMLRLLRSITDGYRGKAEPPPPLPLEEARDLKKQLRPKSMSEFADRALEGGRKLKDAAIPPARVAPDTADSRTGSGFAHRAIGAEQVAELNARRPEGATINDMLIAAVGITVQEWNRRHNEDADKVMAFMPVNLRPAEWSTDVVSNMFSYVSVSTMRRDRTGLAAAAKIVAEQTDPIRRAARAGGTQDLLHLISPLPVGVKRRMPGLLPLTGNRFVDTAVVSNLGRPAELASFFGDQPAEFYFTPPYWSAAAISVGAITSGGTLHLGLRHRLSTLDEAAGNRLADLLVATLTGGDRSN